MSTRLDPAEHSRYPWRVAEIAPDFALIDAWTLPAAGRLEEFADLRQVFVDLDPSKDAGSSVARALFGARAWLGERFGWDKEENTLPIPGCPEVSLRERLPPDLPADTAPVAMKSPFRPVFRTDTEWALEISNATVHAILHLGWVAVGDGDYRGQLGVYVKTRGSLGAGYMHAIAPFRHWIVYPALMKRIDRAWQER